MAAPKENVFYQNGTKTFAFIGSIFDLYHSDDGQNFYPLPSGMQGSMVECKISFSDPRNEDRRATLELKDDKITCGMQVFTRVQIQAEPILHPFPVVRVPEYLFRTEDGQFIYVSADKYQYSYKSFRLFYGPADAMRRVEIKDINRFRDGGTTDITTSLGVLHSPTPLHPDRKSTWLSQNIVKLDHQSAVVTETDEAAVLKT